ncbi:hypothetical protein BGZ63DRAFT_377479, partial [Mariannaea sp. PMI_226]
MSSASYTTKKLECRRLWADTDTTNRKHQQGGDRREDTYNVSEPTPLQFGNFAKKKGSGRGLNPGPLASYAVGFSLSENHTTRPPDR